MIMTPRSVSTTPTGSAKIVTIMAMPITMQTMPTVYATNRFMKRPANSRSCCLECERVGMWQKSANCVLTAAPAAGSRGDGHMGETGTTEYNQFMNVLHGPLEVISEKGLADACEYKWYNQTLCRV